MRTLVFVLAGLTVTSGAAARPKLPFEVHLIDARGSETAAVVDIDRDGLLDVVSGAHWYHAPHWTPYRFRNVSQVEFYVDSFSVLPLDVDGDGYMDIVDVSWFDRKIAWWRNPGRGWGPHIWREEIINACCNVEFAVLADMNNDGLAHEILAQENGAAQAWYEVRHGRWVRHVVSETSHGHGIGAGDVNGDGRTDVLTAAGWLEAPADPGARSWTLHPAWAQPGAAPPATAGDDVLVPAAMNAGGSRAWGMTPRPEQFGFMHVADVNGDGRRDVITTSAHDYGVFLFEQGKNGWRRRTLDNSWSQGHASTLADVDGDGQLDFVTGKRFMAHNGADPGAREPLGLYWYEWVTPERAASSPPGKRSPPLQWRRHVIEYGGRVGAGLQIVVVDLDQDGDNDIVVGGKSGLFWLENGRRPFP